MEPKFENIVPARSLEGEIDAILRRVDALPKIDGRKIEEILDYDEHGLPR